MKIKSLILNNIGCLIGRRYFDLDTTQNKNIIYVEGENGSGKTTICISIEFAIYGSHLRSENKEIYELFVSKLIGTQNFKKPYIEVLINIDNIDYILKRSWIFDNNELVENLEIKSNDTILNEKDSKLILDKIYEKMPYNSFYWDTDKINELGNNSESLKSLIETFFVTDLNNNIERKKLLNQISSYVSNLLKSFNFSTLSISKEFEIILKGNEEENIYLYLSSSNKQLINYAILYSIIKLSKKEVLVIFDDPCREMISSHSTFMYDVIIPNISKQVLLLNHKRIIRCLPDFLSSYNKRIYKRYSLDTIKFGKFLDEDLEWYILNVEDNKALIITKDVIEFMPFGKTNKYIDSIIRKYLNEKFIDLVFDELEKTRIVSQNLNLGDNKLDKVFILSLEEFNKYLSVLGVASAKPNSYVKQFRLDYNYPLKKIELENGNLIYEDSYLDYWLRTSSEFKNKIYIINSRSRDLCPRDVESNGGIRVACVIEL